MELTGEILLALFICPEEVNDMDYNQEYIDLLKRSLAGETETVRLYLAVMAVAPNSAIPTLLEIQADETDHQARIADLLTEARGFPHLQGRTHRPYWPPGLPSPGANVGWGPGPAGDRTETPRGRV